MNTEKNNLPKEETVASSREILRAVYEAMSEKGYNPIGQIVGYLLSEDPTYKITLLNAEMVDISSTVIREAIASGEDISSWLM